MASRPEPRPRHWRWPQLCALLAVVGLLLIDGCASYGNKAYRLGDGASIETPEYTMRFVEADDEGWLWSPKQASDTIDTVTQSAASVDTFVVLFVHGWHHSARCCDDNIEGFKETLAKLHSQLLKMSSRSVPAAAQPGVKPAENFRLIGIYVAWRGASLPGFLDYVTFWGRKSAAQRTGEVDLREFLDRLNQVYRRHNEAAAKQTAPATNTAPNTFLGLVTIGHSFGGQVLLRSVSAALEQELQSVTPVPGYLRSESSTQPQPLGRPLRGFGDLVVLVNPAVESAAYQRLRALSQELTYPDGQTPVMLTVSADNDVPRRWPFRWGRILGEWFTNKPYNEDEHERESERQALGIYSQNGLQITHRLQPLDDKATLVAKTRTHAPEPFCAQNGTCTCEWLEWSNPLPPIKPDSLSWNATATLDRYDFSAETIFNNVVLEPMPAASAPASHYEPFVVASASPAIIDGHSGIFSEPFIEFLTSYIGFIEGKEYLLTAEGKQSKHSP
jgi:hypothetical protein